MLCILEGLIMIYRVLGFAIENQDSTDYLIIQLLGLCADYDTTPVIILCGAVVFNYLDLTVHPGSASGVLDRGIRHTRYLSKHMHYIDRHLQQ